MTLIETLEKTSEERLKYPPLKPQTYLLVNQEGSFRKITKAL